MEDEETDPSFDLNESIWCDGNHIVDSFCEEWVSHLDREDRTAVGIFLYVQMKTLLAKGETEAAELAGIMMGRSDKSIRDWKLKCVGVPGGSELEKLAKKLKCVGFPGRSELEKLVKKYKTVLKAHRRISETQ